MFNNLFGAQNNQKPQAGQTGIYQGQTLIPQFNPAVISTMPQGQPPMPGVGNGSGLGFRPPNIPTNNGGLVGNPFGVQEFDNNPNPFLSNPFFNRDQSLNNDPYGAVFGASNNFGFLPMPANFEPMRLGAIPTENPYINQRNIPTANRNNYQQPMQQINQATTMPIKQAPQQDFLGSAYQNMRMMLLQQLMASGFNPMIKQF